MEDFGQSGNRMQALNLPSSILHPPTTVSTFSFGVLVTLLVILVASGRLFYLLTQQWTTRRPIEALREWADEREFRLHESAGVELPPAMRGLATLDPRIEMILTRGPVMLVRLTTLARPTSPRPVWNLLIRESAEARNPAGLRPASAGRSLVDLFSLNGFPSLLPPERFVAFAMDSKDARLMAASPARGLLPADIGLLVHGPYLTLDFSARPFDAIEFDRMLAIMEQVAR
jgi:hypothetical protein